jgi:hypothetical protein
MSRKLVLTGGLALGAIIGLLVSWQAVGMLSTRLEGDPMYVTGGLAVAAALGLTLLLLLSPVTQRAGGEEVVFDEDGLPIEEGVIVAAVKTPFVAVLIAGIVAVAGVTVFLILFGCNAVLGLLATGIEQVRTLLG